MQLDTQITHFLHLNTFFLEERSNGCTYNGCTPPTKTSSLSRSGYSYEFLKFLLRHQFLQEASSDLKSRLGQNNVFPTTTTNTQKVHVLIPGTFKYIQICGKGKLRFQMTLRLLISRPWDWGDYLLISKMANIIKRVLKRRKKEEKDV